MTDSLIESKAIFSRVFEKIGSIDKGRRLSSVGFAFFGIGMTFVVFHFDGTMQVSSDKDITCVKGEANSAAASRSKPGDKSSLPGAFRIFKCRRDLYILA